MCVCWEEWRVCVGGVEGVCWEEWRVCVLGGVEGVCWEGWKVCVGRSGGCVLGEWRVCVERSGGCVWVLVLLQYIESDSPVS